ncbi:unnamed protein product, partial [Callosobruchus maculatus]
TRTTTIVARGWEHPARTTCRRYLYLPWSDAASCPGGRYGQRVPLALTPAYLVIRTVR